MKNENKNIAFEAENYDDMRMLNTVVSVVRGISPSSMAPVYIPSGDDFSLG